MLSQMPIVFYVFAALTVAGGAMGTVKSHEPWSIIGSAVFGAIAVVGGIMTRKNARTGLIIGLVDALLFVAFFASRFIKSGKFMPAVPSMIMGMIVVALAVAALTNLGKANR